MPSSNSLPARIFRFFASFGLAVAVLLLLLILTWLGTMEQKNRGLHEVTRDYFDRPFVWAALPDPFNSIKIPLPGGYLLMAVFALNILCGGLIRIRKSWRTPGVIIAHFSMLFLLIAGGVSFYCKDEGALQVYEGASGNTFESYDHWQLEIQEAGVKYKPVLVIPEAGFKDCEGKTSRTFFHSSLPFEFSISSYLRASTTVHTSEAPAPPGTTVIDGYYLASTKVDLDQEPNNFRSILLTLKDPATPSQIMLWGEAFHPATVTAAGRTFLVRLCRTKWELPFTVTVRDFTHEYWPGTMKPKVYRSDITETKNGVSTDHVIQMNEPLRDSGYVLFQSSFGPPNAGPSTRMYTVFAVVKNPSDHWPMWACIAAFVGLLIHFVQKLVLFIRKQQRKTQTP